MAELKLHAGVVKLPGLSSLGDEDFADAFGDAIKDYLEQALVETREYVEHVVLCARLNCEHPAHDPGRDWRACTECGRHFDRWPTRLWRWLLRRS